MAVLLMKDVRSRMDPIVPFPGDDRFTVLSPLRRVPVLMDDLVTLSDSAVMCHHLEDRDPMPSVYPVDIALRAQARWLEEPCRYADGRRVPLAHFQRGGHQARPALADRVVRVPEEPKRPLYSDLGIAVIEDSVGETVPRWGPMSV